MLCLLLCLCAFTGFGAAAAAQAAGAAFCFQPPAPHGITPTPASALLAVEPMLQKPEFPNGCEATSLTTVLRYFGHDAEIAEIAYDYIPREEFVYTSSSVQAPHPQDAYAGDPAGFGYYCFAPPVVEGANTYLQQQNSSLSALDISGGTQADFEGYLAKGLPVIIWATLTYTQPTHSTFTWVLPSGEAYHPFSNLHCEVIRGYDETSFYLCDPLKGEEVVEKELLLSSYEALGSHAVVIL